MAKTTPFWLDMPYKPRAPLRGTAYADVAVIGGGITGTSAAYHLARKGFTVALVEQNALASGASGRNTGMAIEGTELDFTEMAPQLGRAKSRQVWEFTRAARDDLVRTVRAERIDCGLARPGSLFTAASPREADRLAEEADARERAGLPCDLLAGDLMRSAHPGPFAAALYSPDDVLLHPVQLVRQLGERAESHGARIYERTEAITFGPKEVRTPQGRIVADKVFVALESYNPLASRYAERQTRGQVILTKPLPRRKLARLGWTLGGMLWEYGHPYHAIRLVGDRLLIAGRSSLNPSPASVKKSRAGLQQVLRKYFPALSKSDVSVSHAWSCTVVHLRSKLPFIGLKEGAFHAFGYAGNGLTYGFFAGRLIAEHFDGKPLPAPFSLPQPAAPRIPGSW
jgi:glycine/D-amino acid oxidase-like deaminating enzyme